MVYKSYRYSKLPFVLYGTTRYLYHNFNGGAMLEDNREKSYYVYDKYKMYFRMFSFIKDLYKF